MRANQVKKMMLLNSKGGIGVWLLIAPLVMSFSFFVLNISPLHQKRMKFALKDWEQVVAKEAARSAIVLMEAALKRRLWDPPPDSNCLRKEDFELEGTTPEDVKYKVKVTYDSENRVFHILSKATYKSTETLYLKNVKVLDASDFLIYSKGTGPIEISHTGYPGTVTNVIAGKKRVYVDSPLGFRGSLTRSDRPTSWSDVTSPNLPSLLGIILQGERFQFMKGLKYISKGFSQPNPSQHATPFLNPYWNNYDGQVTDVAAVILQDASLASQLASHIVAGAPGFNLNTYQKYIYPKVLSCGSLPIMAQTASDSGCYMNNPYYWKHIEYAYGAPGWAWNRVGVTCLEDRRVPIEQRKFCSRSEDFPKTFQKWITDANLKGIVMGSESVPLDFQSLDWDNMEALEEDALACGAIITENNTDGSYEDCDITNEKAQEDYISLGTPPCFRTHVLDTEAIGSRLKNFNPGAYADVNQKDRFIKRVVYSKVKLQLEQTERKGLWSGLSNIVRENLPIWFVSEDQFVVKPHHPTEEQTSPLVSNPGVRRKLYFNQDPDNNTSPLKLILMTPEPLYIISPQHVPYTATQIQQAFPVVGGKIQPKVSIFTDYLHQEHDGYKYGIRQIHMKNITLISNSSSGFEGSFRLRGLWSAYAANSSQFFIQNACMLADPYGAPRNAYDNFIPNHIKNYPPGLVPPSGSRFYYNGSAVGLGHIPYIFRVQEQNGAGPNSVIVFEGLWLSVDFDSATPTGKRDLSQAENSYDEWLYSGDYSDRSYSWPGGSYFQAVSNRSCNSILSNNGTSTQNNYILLNNHKMIFSLISPSGSYESLGSLFAIDLPIIEVSN